MGLQNAPVLSQNAFLENKNYFLLRMIQYLQSMGGIEQTRDVTPTESELVSRVMGSGSRQGGEQRTGFVPAQNCSAFLRMQIKTKQKDQEQQINFKSKRDGEQ